MFDVAIVGSGPAGASCAAFCASAGLRTLLLEREIFPREKVCGDCLNPRVGPFCAAPVNARVRTLPHGMLDASSSCMVAGINVTLPAGDDAEIAIKRSLFDQVIMAPAREAGAVICEGTTVTALFASNAVRRNWTLTASDRTFESRMVVAADGRNSTIARLCNLLPRGAKERIALQTHLPLPRNFGNRVVLQFLRRDIRAGDGRE